MSKIENPKSKMCQLCEGHPANYRGCIVAKELQKARSTKAMKEYGKTFSNIQFTFKGLHGFISQKIELFESKFGRHCLIIIRRINKNF
jgi:hypothetical protein